MRESIKTTFMFAGLIVGWQIGEITDHGWSAVPALVFAAMILIIHTVDNLSLPRDPESTTGSDTKPDSRPGWNRELDKGNKQL